MMSEPLSKKKRVEIVEMDADEFTFAHGKIGERIVHDVQSELHIPEYSYTVKGKPRYKDAYFKEDIKSAVDFFLKYKDTDGYMQLEKDFPEIALLCDRIDAENEYNDWLIKYCFGCVIVG